MLRLAGRLGIAMCCLGTCAPALPLASLGPDWARGVQPSLRASPCVVQDGLGIAVTCFVLPVCATERRVIRSEGPAASDPVDVPSPCPVRAASLLEIRCLVKPESAVCLPQVSLVGVCVLLEGFSLPGALRLVQHLVRPFPCIGHAALLS